jgi:H+/Cl- antiporter ClcA
MLLGDLTLKFAFNALIFMGIGVLFIKLFKLTRRKKGIVREEKFSYKYWIKDNWYDLTLHFLIALLTIRFTADILSLLADVLPITESKDPMFIYLILGVFSQTAIEFIKKKLR